MQTAYTSSNKTSDTSDSPNGPQGNRRFSENLPRQWRGDVFERQPLKRLDQLFGLSRLHRWPDCNWLNAGSGLDYRCVAQHQLDLGELSYEEYIYHHRHIPTRSENWHDLFNALIWRQFPRSKATLNQLHMADIGRFGAKRRTPRRDRITHFDECGVILAYADKTIPELLANHQWRQGLYDNRQHWGNTVQAYVFGHANNEMLLNPYIGLTGKWLGIEVAPAFFEAPMSLSERLRVLDNSLCERLYGQDCLGQKGALHPLPLLGVPGWWPDNQQPEFYDNRGYFMPKRPKA